MEFEDLDAMPEVVQPVEIDEGQQAEPGINDTDPQDNPEPAQSPEENARFAEQRRKQELEAVRRQLADERAETRRLENALNLRGYTGNVQDIADALEAEKRQIAPEQVRSERTEETRRISVMEANHKADMLMMEDLHQVQRLNPAIKAINELGGEFTALRFATDGLGRPLHTAESAYLELQKRRAPQRPRTGDKDHLVTTGGAASNSKLVDIPANELATYQDAFPNDTPAKLKERYNRVRERQGE